MAPDAPTVLVRHAFALFRDAGITDRGHRLAICSFITWRRITTTNNLTVDDLRAIITTLEYWKRCDALEYRCRRIADTLESHSMSPHHNQAAGGRQC